jgi:hypothetical protein
LQGEEDLVTPETHAAAIKQRLKESDVQDKAEFRKRQKENKLALKIKLKKMLGKQDSDDEDAGSTRLEGASGDSASDAEDSDGARGRGGDDTAEEVDAGEELDSRRGKSKGKGKLARPAVAAAGGQDRKKRPRPSEGTDGGAGGYDLTAQEDMALAMIMKRRK